MFDVFLIVDEQNRKSMENLATQGLAHSIGSVDSITKRYRVTRFILLVTFLK